MGAMLPAGRAQHSQESGTGLPEPDCKKAPFVLSFVLFQTRGMKGLIGDKQPGQRTQHSPAAGAGLPEPHRRSSHL